MNNGNNIAAVQARFDAINANGAGNVNSLRGLAEAKLTAYAGVNPIIDPVTLPAEVQDFAANLTQANQAELPAMAERFKAIAEVITERKEG